MRLLTFILSYFVLFLQVICNRRKVHTQDHNYRLSAYKTFNFTNLQPINGATIYHDQLLVYSDNIITIIDINKESPGPPRVKYVIEFGAIHLVAGHSRELLMFVTAKDHCIKSLNFNTRLTNVFTGDCHQWGFADGEKSDSRFHRPRDVEVDGDHYYVADFENSSIRRVDSLGYVTTILTVKAKPYSISGDLYVALTNWTSAMNIQTTYSNSTIIKVLDGYHTYTSYITTMDVVDLESCSLGYLTVVDSRKAVTQLQTHSDSRLASYTLDDVAVGDVVCYNGKPIFAKYAYSSNDLTSMISGTLYQIEQMEAITKPTHILPTHPLDRKKGLRYQIYHAKKYNVSDDELYHPDHTPELLPLHAHNVFPHLQSEDSTLEARVSLGSAGFFVVLTFLALLFVVCRKRREPRNMAEMITTTGFPGEAFKNDMEQHRQQVFIPNGFILHQESGKKIRKQNESGQRRSGKAYNMNGNGNRLLNGVS